MRQEELKTTFKVDFSQKINSEYVSDLISKITQKINNNEDLTVLNINLYLDELFNNNDKSFFYDLFTKIDNLSISQLIDLFKVLISLDIQDKESINIVISAVSHIKAENKLSNALKIQDNYVKEILYNRPHFSKDAKISCLINASKTNESTNIIKFGNLFLNTEKNGNISDKANQDEGESRALGLFTGDMQFIEQFESNIIDENGKKLEIINQNFKNNGYSSRDERNYEDKAIVNRQRIINGGLFEKLEVLNQSKRNLKMEFILSCDIKDIFEVRGKIFNRKKNDKHIFCDCNGELIINEVQSSGDVYGVKIKVCSEEFIIFPEKIENDSDKITYSINLSHEKHSNLFVNIQPMLNNLPYVDGENVTEPTQSYNEALYLIKNHLKTNFLKIEANGDISNMQKTLDKCYSDLSMLTSYLNINGKSYSYIDAGLPRYSALFGRDSIITALQLLLVNSNIAKDTLELLALFQGKTFDDRHKDEIADINTSSWALSVKNSALKGIKELYFNREESKGKILHELRIGELAKTGEIPHSPYYGTVDATPLWLILYAEYFNHTKDSQFLEKLFPNAENALNWLDNNILNGYLRFTGSIHSTVKIQNQGWKDAGDSIKHIVNPKGLLSNPEYPIALAEVQAYVYKAYVLMSNVFMELGYIDKSNIYYTKAIAIKERFNKDFWLENEQYYSMALDSNNIPVQSITSNIGHCLAMGIVDDDKKSYVEDKLLSSELYTGWGIRTLSSKSHAYDPLSYHNGSVWIHDTAFCAMGLPEDKREIIIKNLFEAANHFENNRLPELFAGFSRQSDDKYIQIYPESCSPQAWASGSLIWLLSSLSASRIVKKSFNE